MLQTLHYRHHRLLSMALVALVLLSFLQFCRMNMDEAQLADVQGESSLTNTLTTSHQTLLVSAVDTTASSHDCCVIDSTPVEAMETACPDCENNSPALQVFAGPDLKPLFTLLYIVVQEVLNQTSYVRLWQRFAEPDILSAGPDIYLAKTSFLE